MKLPAGLLQFEVWEAQDGTTIGANGGIHAKGLTGLAYLV